LLATLPSRTRFSLIDNLSTIIRCHLEGWIVSQKRQWLGAELRLKLGPIYSDKN